MDLGWVLSQRGLSLNPEEGGEGSLLLPQMNGQYVDVGNARLCLDSVWENNALCATSHWAGLLPVMVKWNVCCVITARHGFMV